MEFESVVVTGANRGIGLEFVRQFVNLPKPPKFLFATYRTEASAKELKDIQKSSEECQVVSVKMDVNVPEEVSSLRRAVEAKVQDGGLSLLINNAGVLHRHAFRDLTRENLLFHFSTNAVGPFAVLKELYPLLVRSAERRADEKMSLGRAGVLNISSLVASLANVAKTVEYLPREQEFIHGYQISKTALNMVMRAISPVMKEKGVLVVNMCPGYVKTEMVSDDAEITVTESVSSILKTISTLDETHHGGYMDREGQKIDF